MAGTAVESLVTRRAPRTARVRFELATRADDAEVRRLLRESPMPGRISVALEREPDANRAASVEGDVHHTIVARDGTSGCLTAMGSVSVRDRYVNGQPTRVGYLGQLRLDRAYRGRASIIRRGYEFFHELHESLGVKLYLTSIAADNLSARRLLEGGLPGMPVYRPLCEFVTVVFRRDRQARGATRAIRQGSPELMTKAASLLNAPAARLQFAPVWSAATLPVSPDQFCLAFDGGEPVGCAAVWDQRAMKQAVVRGYAPWLRRVRVPLNWLAPLTRLPHLPRVGESLRHAFVSHVATPPERPELIEPLIDALQGSSQARDVDCLTIGFDARDPRLAVVRRAFRGRAYRTQLYVVHWPDGAAAANAIEGRRLVGPEVALL